METHASIAAESNTNSEAAPGGGFGDGGRPLRAALNFPGSRSDRRLWSIGAWVILIALLLGYAMAFNGSRPLWEPDEGRYTAVAVQMLKSGDWWVPRLHPDVPHLTKPPLTYWAIAASIEVFGRHEAAVRLPGAAAFVFTIFIVVLIARRLGDPSPEIAGVVYATFLLPFIAAAIVNTDTLLTAWEALAGFGFAASVTEPGGRRRVWWLRLMWVAFGLAFLTKGPPGVLPLIAFVVFSGVTGSWTAVRRLFDPVGLLLFAVVGLGWFAAIVVSEPGLFRYFVGYEVVDRVFTEVHDRNPGWFGLIKIYGPAFLFGALPWSALLVVRPRRLVGLFRPAVWRRWRDERPGRLLLVLWVVIPLAVFSVAQSRLTLYVLPLFVPLAVLLGGVVRGMNRRSMAATATVAVLLLVGVRWAASTMPSGKDIRPMAQMIRDHVSAPVEEVVFVNGRNHYGLTYYLNADVEHVWMENGTGKGPTPHRPEAVEEELEGHWRNVVFAVRVGDTAGFLKIVADHRLVAEPLGRLEDWDIFFLEHADGGDVSVP